MHFIHESYLLVICAFVSYSAAIRVDWNTNKGPIVPPTPRTTPRPPQLPYRAPAPVWEDQSRDIPNPNPYVYVLPPPSRPRTNNNYNNNNFGQLITPFEVNAYFASDNTPTNQVASLSPKFIPNVGIQYTAVVPGDKVQGKFNAKTKKYKAYEKVKYSAPQNYYTARTALALPTATDNRAAFNQHALLSSQQLPLLGAAPAFRVSEQNTQQQVKSKSTFKAGTMQANKGKLAHLKDADTHTKSLDKLSQKTGSAAAAPNTLWLAKSS